MATKEFEALSIPTCKLTLADATAKIYRVFKTAEEFDLVEAENATEALQKCGTQQACKVRFGSLDKFDILSNSMILREEVAAAPELVDEGGTEVIAMM